jgi:hypothetical protein
VRRSVFETYFCFLYNRKLGKEKSMIVIYRVILKIAQIF